jgi:nucleotide-binding universal stress UspA family protein
MSCGSISRERISAPADLLVMGAYTHNRFMEALLGGATREALAHASIALLMHH